MLVFWIAIKSTFAKHKLACLLIGLAFIGGCQLDFLGRTRAYWRGVRDGRSRSRLLQSAEPTPAVRAEDLCDGLTREERQRQLHEASQGAPTGCN